MDEIIYKYKRMTYTEKLHRTKYGGPGRIYRITKINDQITITLDFDLKNAVELVTNKEAMMKEYQEYLRNLPTFREPNRHERRRTKSKHRGERGFRNDFGKLR
jgi:hypothetical protein